MTVLQLEARWLTTYAAVLEPPQEKKGKWEPATGLERERLQRLMAKEANSVK